MAKRLAKNNVDVQAPVRNRPAMHPVALQTGDWKEQFNEDEVKLLIAEALNHCVRHEGMVIAGYLITYSRVCLVLYIDKRALKSMLLKFYRCVHRLVMQKDEIFEGAVVMHSAEEWPVKIEALASHIFREYPFVYDHLVKLITGHRVTLSYYDPALERLKEEIHNYPYCSAIDYAGGRGPVIVKVDATEEG